MSVNDILDALITSATADKDTLDALIAQLQHTTITSSDDEVYDAPTLNETTGVWTLTQSTANVNGEYVGCYKLPVNSMNSYISSITVVSFSNPAAPNYPASVTPSGSSPTNLTDVTDLEGQAFNSFCVRSATAFEITITIAPNNLANDWDIFGSYHGTIVDRGSDWIEVEAGHPGNGVAYVLIRTNDANTCAAVDHIEFTGGTTENVSFGGTHCGSTPIEGYPADFPTVGGTLQCWNYFQIQTNIGGNPTFTVKIFFVPCS